MVRVSPGMLPAIISVAPNSPSARENPSRAPASRLRPASGSVIVRNTRAGEAPSVAATSSYRRGTCSKPARAARTTSGNPITAIAMTTAFHVNTTRKPIASRAWPRALRGDRTRSRSTPVATGGSTRGSATSVSSSVRPGKRARARSQPTAAPGTSINGVASAAHPSVSRMIPVRSTGTTAHCIGLRQRSGFDIVGAS